VWVDDMVVFDGWLVIGCFSTWVAGILVCWSKNSLLFGLMVAVGFALDVAAAMGLTFYGYEFEDLCLILCTCDCFEGFPTWVACMGVLEKEWVLLLMLQRGV
jgi:hypothetical protein